MFTPSEHHVYVPYDLHGINDLPLPYCISAKSTIQTTTSADTAFQVAKERKYKAPAVLSAPLQSVVDMYGHGPVRFTASETDSQFFAVPLDFEILPGSLLFRENEEPIDLTPISPINIDVNVGQDTPLIFLTGTHGSGKSSICKCLIDDVDYPLHFHPSVIEGIHEAWNVSPKTVIFFHVQLLLQTHIVRRWILSVNRALHRGTPTIFDRSALDMAAYVLSDVNRSFGATASSDKLALQMLDQCSNAIDKAISSRRSRLVYVPPIKNAVVDRGFGKAYGGAYSHLIDYLIKGFLSDIPQDKVFRIPNEELTAEQRAALLKDDLRAMCSQSIMSLD